MLLKLIPGRQEPIIHYTVSFADLPVSIPSPASWTVQMSHLLREDLEVPATLHSLDRAAGIPSLLEEVSLDLEHREVRCRFIDGAIEQFAFNHNGETPAGKFADALEDIVTIVAESTREDERASMERNREREKQRTRSVSAAVVPAAPAKPSSKAIGRHKKHRSLFMQLVQSCVGSMVSLTSPTSSLPHRTAKSPTSEATRTVAPSTLTTAEAEPSKTAVSIPTTPGASARARALRRAARSALVDTFRRFVLGELTARYYVGPNFRLAMGIADGNEMNCQYLYRYQRERGGFCVWIVHSMQRRALERMEQLLEEAGSPISIVSFSQRHREIDNMLQTTTMDVPLSFSDEEDEGDDQPSAKAEESPTDPEAESYTDEVKETNPTRRPIPPRRTSSMTSHSSDSVSIHSSTTSSSGDSTSTAATSVESDSGSKTLTDSASDAGYPLRRESLFSIKEQDHPPLHHLSLSSQQEYMQLYELRVRLNGLVQFAATQARVVVEESRSRAEMLLVRSRRRAWLNKALKHPLVPSRDKSGVSGGSPYGFAAPFRSSPLAMYVVSADDLARQRSAISRGSASSSSSLSSAYFRSVSSMSSTSSSASSISNRISLRPRIRPKIDFEAALAAAVVGLDTNDSDDISEPLKFADVPSDNDCEFEIFDKPTEARRHRRKRAELPVVPPQGTQVFPVTEEQHSSPLRAVRRRNHRRSFEIDQGHRTFMGCDEIRVEDTMHSEIVDKQHFELGFGYPVQMFPPHAGDAPCVEPLSPTDVGAEHMSSETELGMHKPIGAGRPKIRPRMRTNSMIGALLRGAKGAFGGVHKPPLPKGAGTRDVPQTPANTVLENSILCQPVLTCQLPPPPPTPSVSPSFGYISYDHHPPGVSPAPLPKFAANRRAEEISRPSSPVCASATAVYTNPEAGLDVEVNIQVRATDANDDEGDGSVKNGAELPNSTDAPLAAPKKRPSSYLGVYRTNHPRPKLDGVFAEGEAVPC